MLTRKCQQTVLMLLNENDFNLSFTVAQNLTNNKYLAKSEMELIWKGCLYDCIGGEILNTDKKFWVNMLIAKDLHITKIEATLSGRKIGETFSLPLIQDADGVRVTVTLLNGKKLSWIVVKP